MFQAPTPVESLCDAVRMVGTILMPNGESDGAPGGTISIGEHIDVVVIEDG